MTAQQDFRATDWPSPRDWITYSADDLTALGTSLAFKVSDRLRASGVPSPVTEEHLDDLR